LRPELQPASTASTAIMTIRVGPLVTTFDTLKLNFRGLGTLAGRRGIIT
jgi:hypothetical protein